MPVDDYDVSVNGDLSLKPPLWLRPVHRWFWFWERRISSIYRVVAVLVGALVSAWVISFITGVPLYLTAPAAIAAWIGLAIAQEHDERISLPIDGEFYEQLRRHVDPVVATAGLSFDGASGANRARGGAETFTYQHPGKDEILWVFRNPRDGVMGLTGWPESLDAESSFLPEELVERVTTVQDAESDAQAVASAVKAWVNDPTVRLPNTTSSESVLRVRRVRSWFN